MVKVFLKSSDECKYIDIYQIFIGWEDVDGDGDSILVANFVSQEDAQAYISSMLNDKTTKMGHPHKAKFVTLSMWHVVYDSIIDIDSVVSESLVVRYLLPLFRRGVRK